MDVGSDRIYRLLYPRYGSHARTVFRNQIRRIRFKRSENKYLFVLSPPFCGSTLLTELISTSPNVSVNNMQHAMEGQRLPTLTHTMFENVGRWDPSATFDWSYIKKEWRKYWDITQPILVEKSPPNIVRVPSMLAAFPNSYLIILVRNPYAQCESLIRKSNYNPRSAAEFSILCLQYQKQNIELSNQSLLIFYEDLTSFPEKTTNKILAFMPALGQLNFGKKFKAHNFQHKKLKITNLNAQKIEKLNSKQIEQMNEVFEKNKALLNYFNYHLIFK